jgi:hypothetical protein
MSQVSAKAVGDCFAYHSMFHISRLSQRPTQKIEYVRAHFELAREGALAILKEQQGKLYG